MDIVVIGSEGYEEAIVFDVFFTDNTASIAHYKWPEFARELGVKQVDIKKMKQKILMNVDELREVVFDIFTTWVGTNGDNSTLGLFTTKLKKLGWQESIDKLKAHHVSVEAACSSKAAPNVTSGTADISQTGDAKRFEKLIVGGPDCSFTKLVLTISTSDTFTVLAERRSDFSRCLGIDEAKRSQIRRDLDDRRIQRSDAIEQILLHWKAVESDRATLQRLLLALEQINQNNTANSIRSAF